MIKGPNRVLKSSKIRCVGYRIKNIIFKRFRANFAHQRRFFLRIKDIFFRMRFTGLGMSTLLASISTENLPIQNQNFPRGYASS